MRANNSEYNLAKVQHSVANKDIFLDSYPTMVHFLMIEKCNAKCIMCGGDYFRSTSGRKITLEKFKTMAANLKLENTRAVVLAGAGDPLLNRDLVPIVRFINSAYPHISISITTNGLALTEALSRSLLECTIGQINVSINSASSKTYHRMMQVNGFDAVCKNAQTFVELRRCLDKPVSLQFSAAINQLNIEEMPVLVELAKRIGSDSINLFYTRFYPERIRHINIDDPSQCLENNASLFFHQQLSDAMMEKTKSLAKRMGIHLTHEPLFKDHASSCACTWPMTQLMVSFDGEIYPCGGSEVHFKEKVESGTYDFGNALKGPIDQFWNGEAYRALRLSSRQGDSGCVPECKCCANVISPNDIRSHIMDWDMDEKTEITQKSISDPPLISIIVPTYNRPYQLVETIKSIQAQNYTNIEILVVNDNGVDVADQLMPMNARGNITYIRHEKNAGLTAARNTGIRESKGKYIAYLDDGDIFYPDHIQTLVDFLEGSEYRIAYTDAYRAWQKPENGGYVTFRKDIPYADDFDYDRILRENFVPALCIMHERSCLDQVGMFDETLRFNEGWDLWIRMSREFKFGHIKKITAEFVSRHEGSTMTSGNKAVLIPQQGKDQVANGHQGGELTKRFANQIHYAFHHLVECGRHDVAVWMLEKMLDEYPDHALAHYDRAVLAFDAGDMKSAQCHYEKAAELEPDNAILQKNLGDFYYVEQQNLKGALEKYVQTLRLNPEDVETLLSIGQVCMTMGEYEDARYFFYRVLELEPLNENVSQLMIQLEQRIHETSSVQRNVQDVRAASQARLKGVSCQKIHF